MRIDVECEGLVWREVLWPPPPVSTGVVCVGVRTVRISATSVWIEQWQQQVEVFLRDEVEEGDERAREGFVGCWA